MPTPATASLSDAEKFSILRHLGYPVTAAVASINLGFPAFTQPMWIVTQAMGLIPEAAISLVRLLVARCDETEKKMYEAQERLVAKRTDGVELNNDECDQLEREYWRWGYRLAELLGVPVYCYARRFATAGISGTVARI
jgi:hypothetical protein